MLLCECARVMPARRTRTGGQGCRRPTNESVYVAVHARAHSTLSTMSASEARHGRVRVVLTSDTFRLFIRIPRWPSHEAPIHIDDGATTRGDLPRTAARLLAVGPRASSSVGYRPAPEACAHERSCPRHLRRRSRRASRAHPLLRWSRARTRLRRRSAGTIAWPNGIDLDPDVLHGEDASASVIQPRIGREYRLQQTS